jgi:TonB-dependent starch-binding outer membrane protein SusC
LLRVFILGQNLFTITNYKALNPEGGGLPAMRVITAGIQAQF